MVFANKANVMGRFFFHLRDGDRRMADEEGTVLPDLSAAKHEARLCARELLAEAIKNAAVRVPDLLVIADSDGKELSSLAIADVLPKSFFK
jgi:hypothetical protein